MSQELLVNVGIGEVRIARAEDGRLTELAIEPATEGSLVGNIYLGRVVRVVANIGAAFVDIGVGPRRFSSAPARPRGYAPAAQATMRTRRSTNWSAKARPSSCRSPRTRSLTRARA